ncbi:glucosaminidase domain-containing protein [Aquihabitans sp. McL0605]|uniref:glucosaminidase domain-containing protein n=1 Tax=Aquihabitans sp. McL0605 TaxID=3415671 RepID=UPI003CE7D368
MKCSIVPIAEAMHRDAFRSAPSRAASRRAWVVVASAAIVLGLVGGPAAAQDAPTTTTAPVDIDAPKTAAELLDAKAALDETLALAPTDPPPPASPDDPFQAVVDAKEHLDATALARMDVTARSNDANGKALVAAQQLQLAKAKEAAAVKVRTAAIKKLSGERDRLSDLTVRAYVTGGDVDVDQYRAFIEGDTTDPAAGRQIMFGQVLDRQKQVTEQAHERLDKARAKVKAVRVIVVAAEQKAVELLGIASELTRRRAAAEQDNLEALAASQAADKVLRTAALQPSTLVPEGVPLIGLPRLSAEDLAGWFEQSHYKPRVTTPITDYAAWFIADGRAEGIRGDIAFAQAVLETGGFTNTDSVMANNFSGIGHYDNVPLGFIFPSPRIGVRAQIQLLKSYAVKKPHYANPLVDKRLHGPAGCCQTWGDLTRKWATSPTYGTAVMLIYSSIVDYALKRRALGVGFDDPAVAPAN